MGFFKTDAVKYDPASAGLIQQIGANPYADLANRLTAIDDSNQKRMQQSIVNANEAERLAIAKAQEADRVKEVNRVANDRKAVTEAMQSQLLSPELLAGTENVYNRIDKKYSDTIDNNTGEVVINPNKLAMYEKANQAMRMGGTAEGDLIKEFTSPMNAAAYQQRAMGAMTGASPEAQIAASNLLKTQYPVSDNLAESQKAIAKVHSAATAARNKAVGNAGIVTKVTGGTGGSGTGTGSAAGNKSYVGIADTLAEKGELGDNWNPYSTDASQLRDMSIAVQKAGGKVKVDGKEYTLSRNEWADALKAAKEKGNFVFNEGLNSEVLKTAIKDLAGTSPDKGSRYGSKDKVTTKYLTPAARKEIDENEATAVANIRATYGITGAAAEKPADAVARIFKGVFDDTGNDNLAKIAKVASTVNSSQKKAPKTSFKQGTLIGDAMNVSTPNKLMLDAISEPDRFYKEFHNNLSEPQQAKVMRTLEKSAVPEGPVPIYNKTSGVQKDIASGGGPTVTTDNKLDGLVNAYNSIDNSVSPVKSYLRGSEAYMDSGGNMLNEEADKDIKKFTAITNDKSLSQSERDRAKGLLEVAKAVKGSDLGATLSGYGTVAKDYVANNLTDIGNYFRRTGDKADYLSVSDAKNKASNNIQQQLNSAPTNAESDDIMARFIDSLKQEDAEKIVSDVLNMEDPEIKQFNARIKAVSRPNDKPATIVENIMALVPDFDKLPLEVQASLFKMYRANN